MNSTCKQKVSARKKDMEQDFENVLDKMRLDKKLKFLIERRFYETQADRATLDFNLIDNKQLELNSLNKKLQQLCRSLIRTENPNLHTTIESEWTLLNSEKEKLESDILILQRTKSDLTEVLNQGIAMFENPSSLWKTSDNNIRRLLVSFWFSDDLYYYKDK